MRVVNIKVLAKDDEGPMFGDVDPGKITEGNITDVGIVQNGMESGKTSVALAIPTKDGHVIVQISAGQFAQIAEAVRGAASRFGEVL